MQELLNVANIIITEKEADMFNRDWMKKKLRENGNAGQSWLSAEMSSPQGFKY